MKSIKVLFSCVFSLFLLWAGPAGAGAIDWGTKGVADTARVQNVLQITDNPGDDLTIYLPSFDDYYGSPWSSNGQWIVYAMIPESADSQSIEICIIRPDGSGFRQLTNGGGRACSASPQVSPLTEQRSCFPE